MRDLVLLVCVCALAAIGVGYQASAEQMFEQRNIENGTNTQSRQLPQQKAADDRAQTVILSRFSFQRVDDGLLRLDGKTGEVMLCSPHKGGWSCEIVPENHAALEKETKLESENANLRAEVMRLKAELAEMRSARQSPPPPVDLNAHPNGNGFKLRIDNNVEHLRVAVENVWHRMMNMLANFQRDMMRKIQPDHATI